MGIRARPGKYFSESNTSLTEMRKRLILDGAFGTMLLKLGLGADNELLNLSHRDAVYGIHKAYIDAGADIIETNTFGANAISQKEYGHADDVYRMALEGARIARSAADSAERKILVAGSVGPTSKSLSIGTDASEARRREVTFDEMAAAYGDQIRGLMDGGVNLILVETCYDALNAKAAIYAYEGLKDRYPGIGIAVSATPADKYGRVLTGQSIRAFYTAIRHCHPLFFALNCSLGAAEMIPLMEDLAPFVREDGCLLGCYPDAGMPDESGNYAEDPQKMASQVRELLSRCDIDVIGGCCGTTPEHIRAIARESSLVPAPATLVRKSRGLVVSGLECVETGTEKSLFTNVGERTNVSGSRKFARLIAEDKFDEALNVAAGQIEGGAGIIDINMDDALLDGPRCMQDFVRSIQMERSVATAALMIDSSSFETLLSGLKNAQGKCIVNSISLKDGEKEFLRRAAEVRSLGAAAVVMAFDEKGQAVTFERKTEICSRAYKLLTDAGWEPSDIIFDVNVLAVATGNPDDRRNAADFIEAVRWIKANLPGALTSGGISNLSFAFRGNNAVREAMHSVFLYHAVKAGLDMGIVNPSMLQIYDDIDPVLRTAVEDVIFDRSDNAADALTRLAGGYSAKAEETDVKQSEKLCVTELIVKGSSEGLEESVMEELGKAGGDAAAVIRGPLMEGMEKVGSLFGEGRMFLPQVVKSARIMKEAVDILTPYIPEDADTASGNGRPLVVIATVKGDVHDIGKNITATVLRCNGFEVLDLGVMVDKETILDTAAARNAALIAVSGLVTPSLSRMEEICREMSLRGMETPLLVGGAATGALHTAVKLAPLYSFVFHGADASATAVLAKKLMTARDITIKKERDGQMKLREAYCAGKHGASGGNAAEGLFSYLSPDGFAPMSLMAGQDIPAGEVPLKELIPFFDWRIFFTIWDIKADKYDDPGVQTIKEEASRALERLDCRCTAALHFGEKWGFFAASISPAGKDDSDLMDKSLRLTLADAAAAWMESSISVPARYRMIRPAPGYPSCPDHSLKKDILSHIPDSEKLGITFTESFEMCPISSVCGYIVIHKEARYL